MSTIPRLYPNTTRFQTTTQGMYKLEDNAFHGASHLLQIFLKTSRLQLISSEAFRGLQRLNSLTIYTDDRVTVQAGTFTPFERLDSLRLTMNLQQIPSDMLCELSRGTILRINLSHNNISRLYFKECVGHKFTRMTDLTFSDNPLVGIQEEDFYVVRHANVKSLSVSGCGLEEIKPGVLRNLPMLNSLDISRNKIAVISDGVFESVPYLAVLSVGGTNLHFVTQQVALLPQLKMLHIKANVNMSWTFGYNFTDSHMLTDILLEGLHIPVMDLTYFGNLNNCDLDKLYFSQVSIESVLPRSLALFSNLSRLTIREKSFSVEALHNISDGLSKKLNSLELISLGLFALGSFTFSKLSDDNQLDVLDLSENNLKVIGADTFSKMYKLTKLKLAHNWITNNGLQNDAFAGLVSLQILDVSYNNLLAIPNMVDTGLCSNLSSLTLNNNAIKEIAPYSFRNILNLIYLNLNKNGIRGISTNAFVGLSNLKSLNLRTNYITSLHTNLLDPLISLEQIDISENALVKIPSDTFRYNQALTNLHMKNNPLLGSSVLSPDIFRNMSSLTLLDMSGTGLYSSTLHILEKLETLETLYLSNNHIASMNSSTFIPLRSLTMVGLSGNKITVIHESDFEPLVSLKEIDLTGNPFSCNCDTFWFGQWMISTDLNILDLTRNGSYVCASPVSQYNRNILNYMANSNCVSRFGFYLTLYICGGVSLLGVLLAGIFRFRWYFKYYMYLVRSKRRHLLDEQDQNIYQYDAFVCYHNATLKWVINKLLPEMEYKHGFKLCLHDRNWPVGEAIVDTIVNSIEHSRKTLLLVTNQFARSAWCREETELAFSRVVDEQRNLLLVVLMEDIEPRNLSPTLRQLLTTRTYLPWTEGGNKEKRFWEALNSSLKPQGK